jgi:tRNA (mo5U34)-methyltransferase
MTFQSLADFLEPNNPDLTVEGLPAPKRAIVIAEK